MFRGLPKATVCALGVGEVHKSQPGVAERQLYEASCHTGWPSNNESETRFEDIAYGSAHDRLDAFLSAWVAALSTSDRIAFGRPPDDVIWAPRLCTPQSEAPQYTEQSDFSQIQQYTGQSNSHTLICPACGRHEFKRWPFGWDSHAGHRCPGVTGNNIGERKRDFKARFGHMF